MRYCYNIISAATGRKNMPATMFNKTKKSKGGKMAS